MKKLLISILALTFCVSLFAPAVYADDGEREDDPAYTDTSKGEITFEAGGGDGTDPKNPEEPDKPGKPDPEPEPNPYAELMIDHVSDFDFGTQTYSSGGAIYSLENLQPWEDEDGKTQVATFVQVTDDRLAPHKGWELRAELTTPFTSTSGTLDGAEIIFSNATLVDIDGGAMEPTVAAGNTFTISYDELGGNSVSVMKAAETQGFGTYVLHFGSKNIAKGQDGSAYDSVQLKVPGALSVYAETYTAEITWSLYDTPTAPQTP